MAPVLARQEFSMRVGEDRCPDCGGQLAVLAGVLVNGDTPGGVVEKDDHGNVQEKDLERDFHNRVTDRARRKMFVGCGSCRRPVHPDHPRQKKLDQDWRERDAKDQAERDRVAKLPQPKLAPYAELNPVQVLEDRVLGLERQNAAILAELKALRAQLGGGTAEQEGRRKR